MLSLCALSVLVLPQVRSEVEYTQQLCDTCAKELAMEFNEW